MENKTAKQILTAYRLKFCGLSLLYALGLAVCIYVMTKNVLIGVLLVAVLAASLRSPFARIKESTLESVIYEDLDPKKFGELLELGAMKRDSRSRVLYAMCSGDQDKVLELTSQAKDGSAITNPLNACNDLYRRAYVYFEREDLKSLEGVLKDFRSLKRQFPKYAGVFDNYSVFDKFDAFLDEDYEYVVDVCDIDLRELTSKHQNHKLTRINVGYYRAVSLYRLGRMDEAREGFEQIIAFAPKMYKSELSKKYLEKIDQ